MAIFNSFTFDNENSLDSGIYITGEAVFNAPKRVVEMVNVPGRNGAIAIDEGRFENIPVKYPAGCFADNMADFAEKVANFRNILASRFTYKRLEDTYYPDEFRMGLYRSGLEVDVVNQARAGKFDIEFDCKPQRFLKSGEIPVEYTPGQTPSDEQTKTGSIVTFEAEAGTIISDVKADINPVQDLHGYDKPWAGGNGKNKLNCRVSRLKTLNTGGSWNGNVYTFRGITWTVQSADGDVVDAIVANGTASGGTAYLIVGSTTDWSMQEGSTYILSNGANIGTAGFYNGSSSSNNNLSIQFTYSGWTSSSNVTIGIANGATANAVVFKPMIRLASVTDATFEPYSNICPISGWDSVKVTRTGKNLCAFDNASNPNRDRFSYSSEVENSIIATKSISGGAFYAQYKMDIKANVQYRLSVGSVMVDTYQRIDLYIYSDALWGNVISSKYIVANGSITLTFDKDYENAVIGLYVAGNVGREINVQNFMVSLASDADTSYEPYQGNTYTIDLNGTRYGGTLDVTSGVLTLTHGHYAVTGNESGTWSLNNSDAVRQLVYKNIKSYLVGVKETGGREATAMFNLFINADAQTSASVGYAYIENGYLNMIFEPNMFSTSDDVKAWLRASDVELVYELATPLTVQLTPTEASTLLGTNNVWADSGDVTVKYGTNPYIIVNPTDFPSKPLLEVTGAGSFWLGDTQITITGTSGQIIYIDCETGECYKVTGGIISPANGLVTLNRLDFPKLASGINNIQLGSGISKVKITPRWWRL